MKSKLIFPILFLLVAFISSCQKQAIETTENAKQGIQNERNVPKIVAAEFDEAEYNQMLAANEARLAMIGNSSRECVETATVPDDFATIQEAVDAVCDGGDVIVNFD